ncbi:MAG: hypothetical protein IIA00_08490 [Proteobacteria bacterium]|nr:hypothetical protein [Pseudomonadota bacterium]
MVTHERVSLGGPELWCGKLVDLDHGFAYTWEHCYAMKLTTGVEAHLYCLESGDVRIVCPFSERVFYGHVDIVEPYGFCGFFAGARSHPQFATSCCDFACDRGCVCGYLGVDPLHEHDFGFDLAAAPQHGSVHVLDLCLSEQEFFGNLFKDRRRQLRHGDEIDSTITEDQPELRTFFLDRYLSFMRDKEAASFYYFTHETFVFLVAQDNVLLIGARDDDGIAAVSVFTYTRTVGEYFFNVPVPRARYASGNASNRTSRATKSASAGNLD